MPRIRTSMILSAGLALVLIASIACGSKKTEETPKTAATAAASATAAAKTGTSAATAAATAAAKTGGGASASTVAAAICGNWKTFSGIGSGMPAGAPTGAPPAMPNLTAAETSMKQMVDSAPPELKADFAVFAKYFTEYSAAMTRANGDMMKLAQDAAFIKMMESGTTEVDKAAKNIETWTTKNC